MYSVLITVLSVEFELPSSYGHAQNQSKRVICTIRKISHRWTSFGAHKIGQRIPLTMREFFWRENGGCSRYCGPSDLFGIKHFQRPQRPLRMKPQVSLAHSTLLSSSPRRILRVKVGILSAAVSLSRWSTSS